MQKDRCWEKNNSTLKLSCDVKCKIVQLKRNEQKNVNSEK